MDIPWSHRPRAAALACTALLVLGLLPSSVRVARAQSRDAGAGRDPSPLALAPVPATRPGPPPALPPATPPAPASPRGLPAGAVTDAPVPNSLFRRAQVELVVQAPLETVGRLMLDYARYPSYMARFRESRVIHRARNGGADVYIQLELPQSLGVMWFLHRMTVVTHTRDRIEVAGVSVDGNIGSVETRCVAERVPGTPPAAPATHFVFSLLGVPRLHLPPMLVNRQLRSAVAGVGISLRQQAEGLPAAPVPR